MANRPIPQCELMRAHPDVVAQVAQRMPSEDTLFDLSELFKLFGDSTRIRILYALSAGELCVCDIATLLQMTQSAISHQLGALKRSKLIRYRRSGKTVFYSLADDHVLTILQQGAEHVTESTVKEESI